MIKAGWRKRLLVVMAVLSAQIVWVAPSYVSANAVSANADGQVYNVTPIEGMNLRDCPMLSCEVVTAVPAGTDLLNDPEYGAFIEHATGITWVFLYFKFDSNDYCTNGMETGGWGSVALVATGNPVVTASSGAHIRSGPSCNDRILTTVPQWYQLYFAKSFDQWNEKWYEIKNPDNLESKAWVQGWQLTDVR